MSQPEKGSERRSMSIRNKVALRAVLGLFVIAALFLGWQFLSEFLQDPEIFEEADTAGMIAAVEEKDNGSQAVIFTPEGEKLTSPGWTPGTREQTPTWIGDGDHLYFVADREERAFHIYRWIPGKEEVSRRSFGTSSVTTPVTDFNDHPLSETTMLVRKGGTMSLLDLAEGSTESQILPPPPQRLEATGEEGFTSTFDRIYEAIGDSFETVVWGPDRDWVLAVMNRAEGGEVLVFQRIVPFSEDPELQAFELRPQPLYSGAAIDVDVNAQGLIAVAIRGFRWNNTAQIPEQFFEQVEGRRVAQDLFENALFLLEVDDATGLIPVDAEAGLPATAVPLFIQPSERPGLEASPVPAVITPRISPNGDRVMAVLGLFGEGGFQSQQLLVMPAREAGVQQAATLATGQVRSPAWSPGGDLIAFIEDLESGASLVRMNSSGGDRTVLSEEGDYAAPVFSPQLPAGE